MENTNDVTQYEPHWSNDIDRFDIGLKYGTN